MWKQKVRTMTNCDRISSIRLPLIQCWFTNRRVMKKIASLCWTWTASVFSLVKTDENFYRPLKGSWWKADSTSLQIIELVMKTQISLRQALTMQSIFNFYVILAHLYLSNSPNQVFEPKVSFFYNNMSENWKNFNFYSATICSCLWLSGPLPIGLYCDIIKSGTKLTSGILALINAGKTT